jgi:hypothetical protein
MFLTLVVVAIIAAVIFAAVKMGKKSSDSSYISFPCRVCQTPQMVAVAETMRRVREAHAKGDLAALSKHEILCPKCGASQTSDWLMAPRTKAIINELDGAVYRDQTTKEYMNIVSADIPGAPSLNGSTAPAVLDLAAAPPVPAASPDAPPPLPGTPPKVIH